jgi:hypothetical protein
MILTEPWKRAWFFRYPAVRGIAFLRFLNGSASSLLNIVLYSFLFLLSRRPTCPLKQRRAQIQML